MAHCWPSIAPAICCENCIVINPIARSLPAFVSARVQSEVGDKKRREAAALMFLYADEEMQVNVKHTLGYICHFDLPELIAAEVAQIQSFKEKYQPIS